MRQRSCCLLFQLGLMTRVHLLPDSVQGTQYAIYLVDNVSVSLAMSLPEMLVPVSLSSILVCVKFLCLYNYEPL